MGQALVRFSRRLAVLATSLAALASLAPSAAALPPVRKAPGGPFVTDLGGSWSVPRGQPIDWTITLCNDTPEVIVARVFDALHGGDCGPEHEYLTLSCPPLVEPAAAGGTVDACDDALPVALDVGGLSVDPAGCVELTFRTELDLLVPEAVTEVCNIGFFDAGAAGAGQTSPPGAPGPGCSCVQLEPALSTELDLQLLVDPEDAPFVGGSPDSAAAWTVVGTNRTPRAAVGELRVPLQAGLVPLEIVDCPPGASCSFAAGEFVIEDLVVDEAGGFTAGFRTGTDCSSYGVESLCAQAAFFPAEDAAAVLLSDSDPMAAGNAPTCLPVASADLSGSTMVWELVDDADADGAVSAGDRVRFHLTVANRGLAPAYEIEVVDGIALGFDRASVTVDPLGSYDGLTARWSLPSLGPGGVAELWLEATLTADGACNRARIRSREAMACGAGEVVTDDPFTAAFPDATCPTGAERALPRVSKTFSFDDADSDGAVSDGESVTWTFEVRNAGRGTATNVVLEDLLGDCWADLRARDVVLDPAEPAGGVNLSVARAMRVEQVGGADGLAPGETVVVQATLDVVTAAGCCNQAVLTWDESGVPLPSDDPRTGFGPPDATCLQSPSAPVLRFEKTAELVDLDGDGVPGTGDRLRYRLTMANDGTAALSGLVLADELPAGVRLDPASIASTPPGLEWRVAPAPGGAYGAGRVEARGIELAAGVQLHLEFEVDLLVDGRICNRAGLVSADLAPVPSEDPVAGGATCVDVAFVPKAELGLALAVSGPLAEACALPGEEVEQALEWSIGGDADATAAVLGLDHDPALVLVDPDGADEVLPGRLVWNLGDLPLGGTGARRPRFAVDCAAAPGAVTAAASARLSADSALFDASAESTAFTLERPELGVSLDLVHDDADANGTWSPGERVSLALSIEELAGCAAESLRVEVELPPDVAVAELRDGGTQAGSLLTWEAPLAAVLERIEASGSASVGADLVPGPGLAECSRPRLSALVEWPRLPGTACTERGSWSAADVDLPQADCVAAVRVALLREDAITELGPDGPRPPLGDLLDPDGGWDGCSGETPRLGRDRVLLDDAELALVDGVVAFGDGLPAGPGNPGQLIFYEAADSCAPLRACRVDDDADPGNGRESVLLTTGDACAP